MNGGGGRAGLGGGVLMLLVISFSLSNLLNTFIIQVIPYKNGNIDIGAPSPSILTV